MIPPSLSRLPPELIFEICNHLPPDGVLSLKLSHRVMYATIDLDRYFKDVTLTGCSRMAINTYLSKPDPVHPRFRCMACKNIYDSDMFQSKKSSFCIPPSSVDGIPRNEVIELPPRVCSWHVPRLVRRIHTERGGRNEWTSALRDMCMHCSRIREWVNCNCDCGSCGTRTVRTYVRYVDNDVEGRSFKFWRGNPTPQETIGPLYVREEKYDSAQVTHFLVHEDGSPPASRTPWIVQVFFLWRHWPKRVGSLDPLKSLLPSWPGLWLGLWPARMKSA